MGKPAGKIVARPDNDCSESTFNNNFSRLYQHSVKKLLIFLGFFAFYTVQAQKVTGYWYGQANVDIAGMHNNYLTELVIQQKGDKVRGFFGYYFKDIYQSYLVKGTYNAATRTVIIRDIPIIYYNTNSTVNSVECITSFYGTLMVSKIKSSLNGFFYRDKKYEYTCPDLRVNYTLFSDSDNQDSVVKDFTSARKFWKPPSEEYIEGNATAKKEEKKETGTKTLKSDKTIIDTQTNVSQNASHTEPVVEQKPVVPKPDISKINDSYKKRKNLVGRELEITSDSIRLSFYDNGIVDGDSISVFLNNKLILSHQELTAQALNIYIRLDSLLETNEVSMFAENLGKYPPNTAVMIVNDGDNRYEVYMSSDFKGNATVKFKRKKT
jgi:hypothetical protein